MADTVIVVPCYNEAARLRLPDFRDWIETNERTTFLFVNDGSADDTARLLAELPGQMLILGVRGNKDLAERFGSLFADAHWPVLIVHREHEGPAS